MGFEKMKEFTHHLENIFEQVRQNKITVTPELINVIFESIDLIRRLKIAILDGTLDEINIVPFVNKLGEFNEQSATSDNKKPLKQEARRHMLEEHQKTVLFNGIEIGYSAFEIDVQIMQNALMKNVRALLVYNNIKELGEIIATYPNVEVMEDEEQFQGSMKLIILTLRTKEEVLNSINQISEIERVTVKPLTELDFEDNGTTNDKQVQEVIEKGIERKEEQRELQTKISSTVRVDVDKLEHLMNLVGELVIDQTRLVDVRGRFAQKGINSESEFEILDDVTNHLSRVISELQEGMMKTRMLPIEQLFNRFPRMVRDTAIKAGKKIDFVMEGKQTELDRTLIEEISDPIIHLLRNAVDHGIESPEERLKLGKSENGRVVLRASHEENHIVISITDDGKGINPEKIKKTSIEKGIITEEEARNLNDRDAMFLIFNHGISTAEKVTDISGRGVGMDIVKSHIEKLNGIIDIKSTVGEGTSFIIKLPLTLAIIRSLLVKFGEKTFAIPLVNVLEIIRLDQSDIQRIKDQEVGMIRGRVFPLEYIAKKPIKTEKYSNNISIGRCFEFLF